MNIEECLKKIKVFEKMMTALSDEYKTKVKDYATKSDTEIFELKAKYNQDVFRLEQEYMNKRNEISKKYITDLANKEWEQKNKLFEIQIEYHNKRSELEVGIATLSNVLSSEKALKTVSSVVDNESISDAKMRKGTDVQINENNKNLELKSTSDDDNPKKLNTENNTGNGTNKYACYRQPNVNNLKDGNIVQKSTVNNEKITPGNIFRDFLNDVSSPNWMALCDNLKLNQQATFELNKTSIENWDADKFADMLYLVNGFNTNGGGYVCSKHSCDGIYLLAPSPKAHYTDRIVVSNAYLYYFDIKGSCGPAAVGKVTKPAIIKKIDGCYNLVKKGVIEL